MTIAVVDTNVAVAANGDATHVSGECELACIEALDRIVSAGLIVIDDHDLIMNEYQKRLSFSGQPGVGDLFFKHLFDNQFNSTKVERAEITPLHGDPRMFDEFPDDERLAAFDPDDRMFVAAARGSRNSPSINNATDSDWGPVAVVLASWGVTVKQLCPDDLRDS